MRKPRFGNIFTGMPRGLLLLALVFLNLSAWAKSGTKHHSLKIDDITIDDTPETRAERVSLLIKWGYYDEALACQRDAGTGPDYEDALTVVRAEKKAFTNVRKEFGLPENTVPFLIDSFTLNVSGKATADGFVFFCVKDKRGIPSRAFGLPGYLRMLPSGGSVHADVTLHGCPQEFNVSSRTVPGAVLVIASYDWGREGDVRPLRVVDGGLVDVMKVKGSVASVVRGVKPYDQVSPSEWSYLSDDAKTFYEKEGSWNEAKGSHKTETSVYEWKGSSYVFVSSQISWESRKKRSP